MIAVGTDYFLFFRVDYKIHCFKRKGAEQDFFCSLPAGIREGGEGRRPVKGGAAVGT